MLLSMKRKEGITDHYFESKLQVKLTHLVQSHILFFITWFARAMTLSWSMQCTQKKELHQYPALLLYH